MNRISQALLALLSIPAASLSAELKYSIVPGFF
jgi:hypothetical protein